MFPATGSWSGIFAGCELWCLALLDHPDWAVRLKEHEHFVPVAGGPFFVGRRWFALFLVLSYVARGELAAAQQIYRAISLAERGDREVALAICTRARLAFPPDNQWTGQIAGCELWCMALLDRSDWPAHYSECQHFVPTPGITPFGGRRWFAMFLLLAQVTRGDLAAAAALYPVLRQTLDDGWRVGPLQPVEGLVGLAAAAGGNWDVAEGHFRAALVFVDEVGDRLGKPTVQKWYAWMLLRRAAPGDHERARVLLDEAITACKAMGMQLTLGHAEAMRQLLDG